MTPITSRAAMTKAGAILRGFLYLAIALCAAIALCPVNVQVKAWAAGASLLFVSLRAFIDGSWQDAKINAMQAQLSQQNAQAAPLPANAQKILSQMEAVLGMFGPALAALINKQPVPPGAGMGNFQTAPEAAQATSEPDPAPDADADPSQSDAVKLAGDITSHALTSTNSEDGTPVLTDAAKKVEPDE